MKTAKTTAITAMILLLIALSCTNSPSNLKRNDDSPSIPGDGSSDDEPQPGLSIDVHDPSISEGGGSSPATVTCTEAVLSPLTVSITSSDTTEAVTPAAVTIPPSEDEVIFTVTAVDDTLADGEQSVTITAIASGFPAANDTLIVLDDESPPPALTLYVHEESISEWGGSSTATVTRTGAVSFTLTVSITSSDTSEAVTPSTITIPNGSSSANFMVRAVIDAIVDGPQTVIITVSASGYLDASDTMTVLDSDQ
jgi:hypothetical protein